MGVTRGVYRYSNCVIEEQNVIAKRGSGYHSLSEFHAGLQPGFRSYRKQMYLFRQRLLNNMQS